MSPGNRVVLMGHSPVVMTTVSSINALSEACVSLVCFEKIKLLGLKVGLVRPAPTKQKTHSNDRQTKQQMLSLKENNDS